jgi:hypothetical protein
MDTKQALTKLFQIVAKQQTVINKIAQAQGLAPAAPAQAGGEDLTAKLQSVLFAANPHIQQVFIEPPVVLESATDRPKPVVSFKYHMASGKGAEIKAAVGQAADSVLGHGAYLLQGVGA